MEERAEEAADEAAREYVMTPVPIFNEGPFARTLRECRVETIHMYKTQGLCKWNPRRNTFEAVSENRCRVGFGNDGVVTDTLTGYFLNLQAREELYDVCLHASVQNVPKGRAVFLDREKLVVKFVVDAFDVFMFFAPLYAGEYTPFRLCEQQGLLFAARAHGSEETCFIFPQRSTEDDSDAIPPK